MDRIKSELEEKYRSVLAKLREDITRGRTEDVYYGTRGVVCVAQVLNMYYPQAWQEDDGRQILEVLEQSVARVYEDLSRDNVSLHKYLGMGTEVKSRYEDVRDRLLAQWAEERETWAEFAQLTG